MKNISTKVQEIIQSCNTQYLEQVQGDRNVQPLLYNQRETIRRINFYINSKYVERDDDALFWNISNHRITHFTKLISPDTKDFLPYGLGQINYWQAWALKKQVRKWFRDNSFYLTLNDVAEGLATYGSMVWKRVKENGKTTIKEVKLDNLYFDQRIENLKGNDVVEMHYLNQNELWEKEGVWENVREVLKREKNNQNIQVWEFSGYYLDENDTVPTYRHIIGYGEGTNYLELWNEEDASSDDFPYYDFHLGRYRGRWMRTGVVERLFKIQERANQLVNQNAAATEIASLLLLTSQNADSTGNVLEQAINGQIIPDDTLKQLGITNTGLTQFIQEMQMIEAQADRLCLTPEIVQGEASPTNTTFRGIAVVNSGAVSAFKNYRQNLFEKIAEILLNDIFPGLVKGWKREKTIEMAEDDEDVEAYDKAVVEWMAKEAMLSGQLVTEEMKAQMMSDVSENIGKVGRQIELADGFFDFKWGFKMMPTDESVDKTAMNDVYFNALQMTLANPAIVGIPGFKQYLEDNGISPWKLTPKQQQDIQTMGSGATPDMKQPDKLLSAAQPIK